LERPEAACRRAPCQEVDGRDASICEAYLCKEKVNLLLILGLVFAKLLVVVLMFCSRGRVILVSNAASNATTGLLSHTIC
jgi:hypothetical protein